MPVRNMETGRVVAWVKGYARATEYAAKRNARENTLKFVAGWEADVAVAA